LTGVILSSSMYAQTIQFTYDAAGNRISRTVVVPVPPIKMPEKPIALNPQVFPPDEDAVIPAVNQQAAVEIEVFPNPTHGLLNIKVLNLDGNQDAVIVMTDLRGRLLQELEILKDTCILDLTSYPAGIYILSVIARDQKSQCQVVKQ
jgi:hypothetical protein